MAQSLKVTVVGDTADYAKALAKASGATTSFGSKLGGLAKTAGLVAGGAALGGLAVTLKVGISEWTESTKVAAQTAAVLKSTGGVAGVTAKQVDALAGSLLAKTGIDDEAIKSGENLLLTFTNIRNEVGKGNDIFTQATKTTLDMSVALGEDTRSAAIQLGKALNDPIKGVTALQRVGVSFTADQKKQIKSLVDSGHAMEAQKLILRELNKEFGGSAEAAGKTLPGQLKILKEEFNNLAGEIVAGLVPALQTAASFMSEHWTQIAAVMKTAFAVLGQTITTTVDAIGGFVSFADRNRTLMLGLAGAIAGVTVAFVAFRTAMLAATAAQIAFDLAAEANPYVAIATAVLAAVGALVVLYETNERVNKAINDGWATVRSTFETILPTLQGLWDTFGGTLVSIAQNYWKLISGEFQAALLVLRGIFNVIGGLLHGDWSQLWLGLQQIFGGFVKQILTVVETFKDQIVTLFRGIGTAIRATVSAALDALAGIARAGFSAVISAIRGLVGAAGSAAESFGKAILDGIVNGVKGLGAKLIELIVAPINAIIGKINAIKIPGFSFSVDTHLPGVGTVGFSFPGFDPIPGDIPTLGTGGIVKRATLAMIGEKGPEAVVPLKHGFAGGVTVNVTVQGALLGSSVSQVAETIRKELIRYDRNNAGLGFT